MLGSGRAFAIRCGAWLRHVVGAKTSDPIPELLSVVRVNKQPSQNLLSELNLMKDEGIVVKERDVFTFTGSDLIFDLSNGKLYDTVVRSTPDQDRWKGYWLENLEATKGTYDLKRDDKSLPQKKR